MRNPQVLRHPYRQGQKLVLFLSPNKSKGTGSPELHDGWSRAGSGRVVATHQSEGKQGRQLATVAPAFPPDPQNQQAWELEGSLTSVG